VIDFRYHLVSIIAVFLALAIGIVIGANELQPTTETALNKAASTVTQQNKNLTQQNKNLQQQVSADQDFAQAAASRLLGHVLAGQGVVLVTAPGADGKVITGVIAALQQAGATVTGQLSLNAQFFESTDSTEGKLTQLAQSLASAAGMTVPNQPASITVSGQADAAQVIAAAIVTKNGSGLTGAQSQAVLGGFGQSGYLQISSASNGNATTLAQATMAVVVAPSTPPTGTGSSPANLALIAVAQQLKAASAGTVLVGSQAGSGPGSAIDEVSGTGKVSTVDYADQAVGQIITAQALWELLTGHSPTSYGVNPGAVPSPAPTPSVSPTTTAARQVRK
jgi:Copper transport outer membrane protein, MctB